MTPAGPRSPPLSDDAALGPGVFLPRFCSIQAVFGIVLGGQLLVFVLVLAAGWRPGRLWENISLLSLYVQWIGLCCAALLCLLQRPLQRLSDRAAGVAAWVVVQAVTALIAELAWRVPHDLGAGLHLSGLDTHWDLLGRSLAIGGIVSAVLLRHLYLDRQRQAQALARSEARFQALQARIRPHFLFNSMNTVASLTRTDPARAEAVVEDLADLFRAALGDPAGGSSLGEEMELVRRYLGVEQQRLGARLRVEWDLEDLPEQAPLPLLVLQPLVENAVYHGIEPSAQGGIVRIAGRYRGNRVNVSVRNSLPSAGGNSHREGNRMALDNVRQRLAALYPGAASLTLGRVDDEYQVRLVFPYP